MDRGRGVRAPRVTISMIFSATVGYVRGICRGDGDGSYVINLAGDIIADWKQTPSAVGIRIIMTKEAKREPNDPDLDRILRAAVKRDFPVNILCWGNVDAGTALIDRHPDTSFIIDHLAILQPRTPPAPPQPWADLPKVLDLAKRKNAVIKVSGACTLSRNRIRSRTSRIRLPACSMPWGFERCLWGTDWTRAYAARRRCRQLTDQHRLAASWICH